MRRLNESQVQNLWYTHRMEYDSAFRKKAVLPSEATRMNPEDITLSAQSQTQKDTGWRISLTRGI